MKEKLIKFHKTSNQRGITLIALVITIVILIILATVSINVVLGEGGLIQRAQQAKDMTEQAALEEQEGLNSLISEFTNIIAENQTPPGPFEPQPTPEPEQGETELADADKTNGVIEIKWLSGTSDKVSTEPNAPLIKENLPERTTMELVRYTGEGTTERERWVAGTEYSYLPGTGSSDNRSSKWANARVTIDGIDSYFVWIPRYAYRIIYFDSNDSKIAYQNGTLTEEEAKAQGKIKGYSDSRGIVDAEGKKVANVESTTKTMVSKDYFMVHPAFTADVTYGGGFGNNNGSSDNGISGLWIGKYEAARSDTVGSTQGNATTLKVQPGQTSFRGTKIGDMYTYAREYSPTDLKSHMLKNSEWGAVAYLTESTYGRNGTEIGFNTNSSYLTGGGIGTAYVDSNKLQSSTGNEYGIYDLRGGASEYVAGYYNGSDANTAKISNGSSFASIGGSSNEYSTAYNSSGSSSADLYYKYGDATYETSGWHSDYAGFVNSNSPFFKRGGYYKYNASSTGVFCYYYIDGVAFSFSSFRLALVV